MGAAAFMSTPPNPAGLVKPVLVVAEVVAAAAAAVVVLVAPNNEPPVDAPNPPSVNVGAAEVLVDEAAAPKGSFIAGIAVAAGAAVLPGSVNPVEVLVDVAWVVVVPKLKLGAAVVAVVVIAGFPSAPNAGGIAAATGATAAVPPPKPLKPIGAVAAAAGVVLGTAVGTAAGVVVVATVVLNENAGALVVGVPKLNPDIELAHTYNVSSKGSKLDSRFVTQTQNSRFRTAARNKTALRNFDVFTVAKFDSGSQMETLWKRSPLWRDFDNSLIVGEKIIKTV